MIQEHFLPIQTTAEMPGNWRSFEGNDLPALPTPGLISVRRVLCGGVEIPLAIEEQVPVSTAEQPEYETQTVALVKLDRAPDGAPVLLRSIKSNHGIWQRDAKIDVEGDWEAEKAAKKA